MDRFRLRVSRVIHPSVTIAMVGLVAVGCSAKDPSPGPSSSPTSSASPVAIPASTTWEAARATVIDGQYDAKSKRIDLAGSAWYMQGACSGGGSEEQVPYVIRVDNRVAAQGTIVCDTGKTYINSAFSGVKGLHDVDISVGDGLVRSTRLYVRVVPEGHQTD